MEKLHNKENQLYSANGDSRKKKMLRQVFAGTNISLKDYPTEKKQNRYGFFLIAQWHNLPFQNTNTFVEVYRRRACNFKEAVAETLCSQSAHVSAQTRSQLYLERKYTVCSCVRDRKRRGPLAPVTRQK